MKHICISALGCLMALICLQADAKIVSTGVGVEPICGVWSKDVDLVRARAKKDGIPVFLVGSSSGCDYCAAFSRDVMDSSSFKAWQEKHAENTEKPYLFLYVSASMGNWLTGQPRKFAEWVGLGSLPRVSCYWYDNGKEIENAKDNCFAGRGKSAQWYMDWFDKTFKDYSAAPKVTYFGGYFSTTNTPAACLQAESETTYVDVPMYRTETVATNQFIQLSATGMATVTDVVTWKSGVTAQSYRIENFTSRYITDRVITLKLLSAKGEVKSETSILCVEDKPNSAGNPFWLGERTFMNLQWGDWSMDLAAVTNRVARWNRDNPTEKAYALMLVSGSKWCPDCLRTDHWLFENEDFKQWAKSRKVVFGVVDVPQDPTNPKGSTSLLQYETMTLSDGYVNAIPGQTQERVQSGAEYLSRKMAKPEDVEKVMSRNRDLCTKSVNAGGWAGRDNRDAAHRPGVPTLILVRADGTSTDGTIAGRFVEFSHKSPTAFDASYLTRLDELLAQADMEEEEFNDYRATAQTLKKEGLVIGSLSHTDPIDTFAVPAGSKIGFTVKGDAAAEVELRLVQVGSTGAEVVKLTATNRLDRGVSAVYDIPSGATFYLELKTVGDYFRVDNPESTACSYELGTDAVLTPTEAEQTDAIPSDERYLTFEVKKDVTYRITNVDAAFRDDFLVNSSGDLFVGYADAAVKVAFKEGANSTAYQIWNTGKISFIESGDTVDEVGGTYMLKVARLNGVAGKGAVTISVDETRSTQLDEVYEFAANGTTNYWDDGTSETWEVPVKILNNQFADGDQTIVFKLAKIQESDVGVALGEFTLVVRDDDTTSPGKLSISATDPARSGTLPVYAREGQQVVISLARTGGSDGVVGCTLTTTDGTLDKSSFVWGTRDAAVKTARLTVPAFTDDAQTVTVAMVPNKGSKVISSAKSLSVKVVPAKAPGFEKTSETYYNLVRNVDLGKDRKIAVTQLSGTGDVKVSCVSGSLPGGVTYAYLNGALVFSGVPTVACSKTAVFRVSEGAAKGMTVTVSFQVTDAIKGAAGGDPLNAAIAKTRTFSDIVVINGSEHLFIGKLSVTIPPSGRVSAKYVSEQGTVSLSAKNWSKIDTTGALTAEAAGTTAKTAKYTLTVTALADGSVTYSFYDPTWPFEDEILFLDRSTWSDDTPASLWQGYYTVSLPQEPPAGDTVLAKGDGYLTLKMNTSGAIGKGKMTYAGLLPTGKAISGSASLKPIYDAALKIDTEAVLPVWQNTSADFVAGLVSISPNAMKKHQKDRRSVYPFAPTAYGDALPFRWKTKSTIDVATYESAFGVYGGYYDGKENFETCCSTTFATTELTFFALPTGLEYLGADMLWTTNDTQVKVGTDNSIRLVYPVNDQDLTLSFTKSTGIVSGSFDLYNEDGLSVPAKYRGVVMPGWGTAGCSICNPGTEPTDMRPFISGACWFSEKISHQAGSRKISLMVNRGCPFSIGTAPGQ